MKALSSAKFVNLRPMKNLYVYDTYLANRICKKGSYTRFRFCNFDES